MTIRGMSDRELDAKVAIEVMMWRLLAGDTWVDDKNNIAHPNFRPSRHISAAMLVVEKFDYVQLEIMRDGVDCEIWKSTEREFEEWMPVSEAYADTAPRAICEAAVKAVEAE